nr:hypothetical protein [bacterium]
MKISRNQLIFLKSEIISSMTNNGAKKSIEVVFQHLEDGSVTAKHAERRIVYYIRMGYSKIKSWNTIKELYGVKKYYTDNKDEYGDIYENKILDTFYK